MKYSLTNVHRKNMHLRHPHASAFFAFCHGDPTAAAAALRIEPPASFCILLWRHAVSAVEEGLHRVEERNDRAISHSLGGPRSQRRVGDDDDEPEHHHDAHQAEESGEDDEKRRSRCDADNLFLALPLRRREPAPVHDERAARHHADDMVGGADDIYYGK